MLDGAERRSARATAVAADQHHVGVRLGYPRGHRAHTHFGHQLHRNARARIDVLQIVDELGQVLDGVDVVVRRRRNQAHAGDRVAHPRDGLIHLVAGKLPAFPGLGPLRHLDLQFVGVHQVVGGHPEAPGSHLFHRAAALGPETLFVFPALAGVGLAADAVHGDGQGLVGFFRNRAERHGPGGEALDDVDGRLHFFERNRIRGCLDFQQAAQRRELAVLPVDHVSVFLERPETLLPHGLLQLGDGLGVDQVVFAARAVLIIAASGQVGIGVGHRAEGVLVLEDGLLGEHLQIHPFNPRSRSGEVLLHQLLAQADGLEDLRTPVALQRRYPHFRECL